MVRKEDYVPEDFDDIDELCDSDDEFSLINDDVDLSSFMDEDDTRKVRKNYGY